MLNIEKIKSLKSFQELLNFSIINIDKPSGPTSFWTSQFVKKSLNLKKTSHLGTLDPMVTGVLPVALNRACRLSEYLMHRNKTYVGIIRAHTDISHDKIEKQMKRFVGDISQLPPVRSAVKRAHRIRKISSFKILEKKDKEILFESEVQAGTYIRKLIHDLGESIPESKGAHMLELRRTKAGIFTETDKKYPSVNLYDFEKILDLYEKGDEKPLKEILIPGEIITTLLPCFEIRKDVIKKVLSGSPIFNSFFKIPPSSKGTPNEKVCIISEDKLIGCYKLILSKDVFAVPEFVLN
jgi:H/ACA ribonucleoprotein complex subunit 4